MSASCFSVRPKRQPSSLTVAALGEDYFEVSLIPTTLAEMDADTGDSQGVNETLAKLKMDGQAVYKFAKEAAPHVPLETRRLERR